MPPLVPETSAPWQVALPFPYLDASEQALGRF